MIRHTVLPTVHGLVCIMCSLYVCDAIAGRAVPILLSSYDSMAVHSVSVSSTLLEKPRDHQRRYARTLSGFWTTVTTYTFSPSISGQCSLAKEEKSLPVSVCRDASGLSLHVVRFGDRCAGTGRARAVHPNIVCIQICKKESERSEIPRAENQQSASSG